MFTGLQVPVSEPLVDRIASRLLAVRSGAPPLPVETLDAELDSRAKALAVQARVMARLGAVGGWKCGGPSPDTDHVIAPIPADRVFQAPSVQKASAFRLIGIELEVGFVLDRLPDGSGDELRDCARAIAAIEIVDSRLAEPVNAPAAWKLADMQLNGALVYDEAIPTPVGFDPAEPTVELLIDGQVVVSGPARCPGGHPLDVLSRLLRDCGNHCGGVRPGQPIITGSLTGLRFVRPGARVLGRIAGLGEVSIEFRVD